jgi:hypothetical protein
LKTYGKLARRQRENALSALREERLESCSAFDRFPELMLDDLFEIIEAAVRSTDKIVAPCTFYLSVRF